MPDQRACYDFDSTIEALALVASTIAIKGVALAKVERLGSVIRVMYDVTPEGRGFLTGVAQGVRKANEFGYEIKYHTDEDYT